MNELKAVEEVGMSLDPPSLSPPDQLRERVMATAAQHYAGGVWRAAPRLGWRVAVAAATAVVLTAAVLAIQVIGAGDRTPASAAQAAEILRNAAAQALSRPSVTPRDDQFIYIETIGRDRTPWVQDSNGHPTLGNERAAALTPYRARTWSSVDGTRDSLTRKQPIANTSGWHEIVIVGCRPGMTAEQAGQATLDPDAPCVPRRFYQTDLPSDADHMLDHLYRDAPGDSPPDQRAFAWATDLLAGSYLPPGIQAAILGAIAKIPTIRVLDHVTDEAGRAGIGVVMDGTAGSRYELIFDRQTHDYLGSRLVAGTSNGPNSGDVHYSTAVLTVAVVDQPGQLP